MNLYSSSVNLKHQSVADYLTINTYFLCFLELAKENIYENFYFFIIFIMLCYVCMCVKHIRVFKFVVLMKPDKSLAKLC